MSRWVQVNTPKVGEEWKPMSLQEAFEKGPPPVGPISVPGDFKDNVVRVAKPYFRDEELQRARDREHVIEDPLALYVPYHSPEMGIYFRVKRMLSDFQAFASKYSWPSGVTVNELWHIYVMTIFWHEMAHHVVEDVATLMEWMGGSNQYPLMSHLAEERFCEFNAFTTAERQPSPPGRHKIPLLPSIQVPSGIKGKSGVAPFNKRLILSCLYYHWGRDYPTSTYRPIVEGDASHAVDGLWNGLWGAHKGGYDVVKAPYEIYKCLYCTTL